MGFCATTRKSTSSRPAVISWSTTTPSSRRVRRWIERRPAPVETSSVLWGMTVLDQSRAVEPGRQKASMYQISRAPPGRWLPWTLKISFPQVSVSSRSGAAEAVESGENATKRAAQESEQRIKGRRFCSGMAWGEPVILFFRGFKGGRSAFDQRRLILYELRFDGGGPCRGGRGRHSKDEAFEAFDPGLDERRERDTDQHAGAIGEKVKEIRITVDERY